MNGCGRALLLGMVWVGAAGGALGQTDGAAVKGPAFEVVSIKPNNSGMNGGSWGANGDGYSSKNAPMAFIILQAYSGEVSASLDRLKGAPSWATSQGYDIKAKVDDAMVQSLKGLNQDKRVRLLAPMLRSMLEERCKLAVHTEPVEVSGYALVVGKRGVKMTEYDPKEPAPTRVARFEDGMMLVPMQPGPDAKPARYLNTSMAQLVRFMGLGKAPILDQTGLTGRYDFDLIRVDEQPVPPAPGEGAPPPVQSDPAHMFDWGALGLEMKPIKVKVQQVVIDHIEKPSEN